MRYKGALDMKNKLIVSLTVTTLICTACGKAATENQTRKIAIKNTQTEKMKNNFGL